MEITPLQFPTLESLSKSFWKYSLIPTMKKMSPLLLLHLIAYAINDYVLTASVDEEKPEETMTMDKIVENRFTQVVFLSTLSDKQSASKKLIQLHLAFLRKAVNASDKQSLIRELSQKCTASIDKVLQQRFQNYVLRNFALFRSGVNPELGLRAGIDSYKSQMKIRGLFEGVVVDVTEKFLCSFPNEYAYIFSPNENELEQFRYKVTKWAFSDVNLKNALYEEMIKCILK